MKGRCVFGVTARALPWGRVRQREALRCKSGNHSQTSVQASMHPQARPFARSGACVWMSVCSRCVPTSSSWGRVWVAARSRTPWRSGVSTSWFWSGGALAAGAGELVPARGIPRPPIQAGRTVARRRRPRVRSRRALRRRRQHEGLRREPSPVPRAGLHRGRAPGGDLAGVALGYADLEPYLRRGRADVPCRRHDRRGPDRARGAAPPSRTAPWSTSPTSPTSCRRRRTATRRSGAAPHPNRRPRSLATCLVGKAPRELRQR
jgi:hypothetical protein